MYIIEFDFTMGDTEVRWVMGGGIWGNRINKDESCTGFINFFKEVADRIVYGIGEVDHVIAEHCDKGKIAQGYFLLFPKENKAIECAKDEAYGGQALHKFHFFDMTICGLAFTNFLLLIFKEIIAFHTTSCEEVDTNDIRKGIYDFTCESGDGISVFFISEINFF